MQTLPKAGMFGFNWFNVWYTPGISQVSTTIRDNNETSWDLTGRGNYVAVVSDSTRVLGDGDCTPPGGLGVMEGKAFLMKYLGGIDATALCINSRDAKGKSDPQKIIDFVKMAEPSFGAVNLEDISQPNCYKVLDTLRKECSIPVWHDDAQGTACVTLAGLINALKLVDKKMEDAKIVLIGAGASNTTIAKFILKSGGNPEQLILFDSTGALHSGRADIEADTRYYKKWELCAATNPKKINDISTAMKGADVLIALSKPGPNDVMQEWIRDINSMFLGEGLKVKDVLIWDKKSHGAGDLGSWAPCYEMIIYATKNREVLNGNRPQNVLRYWRVDAGATGISSGRLLNHPTEKPVPLFSDIINKHSSQTILDPFMGSGTTLRAAKDLGRKAIGIEIEEKYCHIAAKRMSQSVMDLGI